MIRGLDIILSLVGLISTSPILAVVVLLNFVQVKKPLLFQTRMGANNVPFTIYKIRTMYPDTPTAGSHLIKPSSVTPLGQVLRKTKIDELPQLLNVLRGEMTLVGPRPCLVSQTEIIKARNMIGIANHKPGITGLAQLLNIDMSTPTLLAETDARLINILTPLTYCHFVLMTILPPLKIIFLNRL